MTLWLVRAGRYGEREQFANEKNLAILGWEELPDLSKVNTREELANLLSDIYPDEQKKTLINWESQLWPFVNSMQIGDLVAMPLKHRPISNLDMSPVIINMNRQTPAGSNIHAQ